VLLRIVWGVAVVLAMAGQHVDAAMHCLMKLSVQTEPLIKTLAMLVINPKATQWPDGLDASFRGTLFDNKALQSIGTIS
jgi:hypothetical protein